MSASRRNTNPADAVWEAFDQFKAGFDKRVGTRMGRGDVRSAVLVLLADQPMHGYQVIREIEERTDGRWKPSAGSVYPTLQLLADEGLVTAEVDNDRKTYALTDAGREAAAEATAPWTEADAPKDASHLGHLSKAGFDLAQSVAEAARTCKPEQQEQVTEVLKDARRKVYSILAQS